MIITRFAPSPTGRLHLGHAYSAIVGHDFARDRGGRFILRIEDIDATRCRPHFVDDIRADLAWLGLACDELIFQSARHAAYAAALGQLRAAGLAYPCFCSRGDIAREAAASLHAPHGPDGPLYPGTCRRLDPAERNRRLAHEPHCWRLDAGAAMDAMGSLTWTDLAAGTVAVDPGISGDFILKGRDRPASYHLAVVVDDAAQAVSHVIRGRDIFPSTHAHRLLQALLGLPVPLYFHHPLVLDGSGKRLAKRDNVTTLASRRENGDDGRALADQLRARHAAFDVDTIGFAVERH